MPVEIKIECECGNLITKSNISTHKKSKIHNKNMLAIGTVEPQEFENSIICEEVKAVQPKVKVAKKTVSKKTKPVEDVVAVIEEVIKTNEEEEVKPVEEVCQPSTCDILEYLQRIENHLKKIDDFYSKLEIPHIECDITNEIKNISERLNKIENLQIEEVEIVDVVEVVDVVEEVQIVKVVEEVEIVNVVEEVQIVEEVEMVNKKVNHKEIPNTNWLEYIPDDESYSTLILTYVKDNLNIDKRIMEFLKVRYIYINNKCRIQIFASDNITDNPVISFYQCNTKQEHFKSDANAFSIHLDSCIEFRADFLKKKKYNNFFSRRHSHKIVKRENEGAEIFFKIEQEIIKYSLDTQNILEEKKKDDCATIVVKQQPQKKNYMKILPTEILDIIYEYSRDNGYNEYIPKTNLPALAVKEYLRKMYHFGCVDLCAINIVMKKRCPSFHINIQRIDHYRGIIRDIPITIRFNGKGFEIRYDNCISNDDVFKNTTKFSKGPSKYITGSSFGLLDELFKLKDEIMAYRESTRTKSTRAKINEEKNF